MREKIIVHGARVHNLKNVDLEIPLGKIVGICGVSGSGKSSLALGVLHAEGSRRYLESLSTYTRRRMTQAPRADVDEVLYIPASIALHQRPGVPDIRSTFGTGTELLNVLRLMFSRLASHRCPNGHYVEPSMLVAAGKKLRCPICGEEFYAPSAEELSFNSAGACPVCDGIGTVHSVDFDTLVPDDSLSIDQGAVAPWKSLMWSLMTEVAKAMGVRTDVPFRDLTDEEKDIVYNGPMVKKHIIYQPGNDSTPAELNFTYYSAVNTVKNSLSKVKDEKGMKRVEKFLKLENCSDCHGTRLNERARSPRLRGITLPEACAMTLSDLDEWVSGIPDSLPPEMHRMAEDIVQSFHGIAGRLLELGLGYLTLDRSSSTLSTGERQRMQLARAVRNRTTGVMYVLDEPSIGLHPANIRGLKGVMEDLIRDGNSVILVDHDPEILSAADHIIEMGPGSGADGGYVLAEGSIAEIVGNPVSKIGPFLSGKHVSNGVSIGRDEMFSNGCIRMEMDSLHTVKPLTLEIPKGRLSVVTGVSGSGKTTVILESLVPALEASISGRPLPSHVKSISHDGIERVKLMDSSPIGINIRSTVATYAGVHDELRKAYARTEESRALGLKAGDFSYNTGKLRCPLCDGTGSISLDVQFLPDVEITCPECHGSRYSNECEDVHLDGHTLPDLMAMDVHEALESTVGLKSVHQKLEVLDEIGLGYLTLGEATPSLSGGEAQRLKLSSEMGRIQKDTLFVFDEPTIGLHPLDVDTLLGVFRKLISHGATVVVIEHDLDLIRNADHIIDMGPGGGDEGGTIVATGTPEDISECRESITGRFL